MTDSTIPLLGSYVSEVSDRLRGKVATVYSVTNDAGFVRSLDLFDKQVFSADIANYKSVAFGDIAYNPSRINVGSVAICTDPGGGAVSPMYVVFRCNPDLRPEFLLYFLKSDIGRADILHRCHGAVRSQLRFKDLCGISIRVPDDTEQQRLVGLLDSVVHMRQLRRQSDSLLDRVGPALFAEMFGDPARPDGRWKPTTIGALGKVVTGNTPSRAHPEYFGDAIEWVKTDNIDSLRARVAPALEGLSEAGIKVGRLVPAGSVIITCIAGSRDRIGDAAIVDKAVAINQQINALVPDENVEPIFAYALITALKPVIQHRTTGVMTGIISKKKLESIPAIRPPIGLQREFVARLAEAKALASRQSDCASALDRLYESMLHNAFSGRP